MKKILLGIFITLGSAVNAQWSNTAIGDNVTGDNVGIGTTTPDSKLEIKGTTTIGQYWNPDKSFLKLTNGSQSLIFDSNEIYGNTKLLIGSKEKIVFRTITDDSSSFVDHMTVNTDGNVGIGTGDNILRSKLSVNGTIWATEVKISLTDAADWVFKDDYKLRSLKEVEQFVKTNKHLPEIPSAEDFRKNDLKVSEMTNKLLQKIEELTLYAIEQEKKIALQEQKIVNQEEKEKSMEERLLKIEELLRLGK